jgi:hypothetical protein
VGQCQPSSIAHPKPSVRLPPSLTTERRRSTGVLYAPGLRNLEEVRQIVRAVNRPVNVVTGWLEPRHYVGAAQRGWRQANLWRCLVLRPQRSSTQRGPCSGMAHSYGCAVLPNWENYSRPDLQLCIRTSSLAIIVPTTLRSYHTHEMRGLVLSDVMRRWALPSMAGVAVGSGLTAIAPADILKATFVVIAYVIASKFLIGGERWVVGTELPDPATLSGYGFVIGLASSLMGISGGSLVTMVLTRYGKPAHNAVATAAGIGVPITLAGTIGYALAGLPHLLAICTGVKIALASAKIASAE